MDKIFMAFLISGLIACSEDDDDLAREPLGTAIFSVSSDRTTYSTVMAAAGESARWRVDCAADGQGDERFSGMVQCALYDLQGDMDEDLFGTLEQDRSWQSRGRFVADHLAPGCAETPDWGAHREFHLRGHVVTLAVPSAPWNPNNPPQSFDLFISVARDPSAVEQYAPPPETPEPRWFYFEPVC